jgi:hypothetical protein
MSQNSLANFCPFPLKKRRVGSIAPPLPLMVIVWQTTHSYHSLFALFHRQSCIDCYGKSCSDSTWLKATTCKSCWRSTARSIWPAVSNPATRLREEQAAHHIGTVIECVLNQGCVMSKQHVSTHRAHSLSVCSIKVACSTCPLIEAQSLSVYSSVRRDECPPAHRHTAHH